MAKKTKVAEEVVNNEKKANIHDFDIIIEPVITEKSMAQSQEGSKYTIKVKKTANKTEIRNAVSKIFGVHVVGVQTVNVMSKNISRGSRYKGTLPSYKKAIVTLKEGEVINLFAE